MKFLHEKKLFFDRIWAAGHDQIMGGGGRSARRLAGVYSKSGGSWRAGSRAAAAQLAQKWLRSGSAAGAKLAANQRQVRGGSCGGPTQKRKVNQARFQKKLTKKFLLVLKRIKTKVNQTHLLNMRDLTLKLEKLSIKCPIRPRPDLRKLTKCNLCGCVLTWRHMLPRHQATTKCLVLRTSLG